MVSQELSMVLLFSRINEYSNGKNMQWSDKRMAKFKEKQKNTNKILRNMYLHLLQDSQLLRAVLWKSATLPTCIAIKFFIWTEFVNRYTLSVWPLSIIYQIKGHEMDNNRVKIIICRLASPQNIIIGNYSCLLPLHEGSLHIYKKILNILSI